MHPISTQTALPAFVLHVVFSVVVARAAALYRRSPVRWFFLALCITPLIAYLFLRAFGDTARDEELAAREEQLRQRYPDRKDLHEAALNAMNCPTCGTEVNPITGDGLHTPEKDPWLLICNHCRATVTPDV